MDSSEIELLRQGWSVSLRLILPTGRLIRSAEEFTALDATFDDLRRRYEEPTRHYHTLDHVRAMLEVLHADTYLPVMAGLHLAVFLHDVIYDSRAKDNEQRSADYAREVLASFGVDPADREEIARLILLTKRHETTEDDKDGQAILDADLSILSASDSEYDAYAAAIRREYDWVSDDDYRTGRRQVLQRFLARPRIYYTERMFEQCESKARANLAREIASLGG
jgi:predicted metal-dependent HD superfamily phosphohydrolase